jgi:uncharacterized protein
MSEAAVTAARTLIESFRAGDVDKAFDQVHPEGVIHEADELWYGGDWTGPEGFRKIIGIMSSKLDLEILDYEVYDSHEVTVMNARIRFTSKSSGRQLEMPIVELYRERDGKLVDMDIFYKDTAAVIELANEAVTAEAAAG